jgi:hypothetical protein
VTYRGFGLTLARVQFSTLVDVAVGLYITLVVANSLVPSSQSVPRRVLVILGLGILSLECLGFRSGRGERWFLLGLGLWIAIGLWAHGLVYGEMPFEGIYLPCSIGVALAIARGHVRSRTVALILAGLTLLIGQRLVAAKGSIDLYTVLATSSANGVSETMIALAATYYLCARIERRPISPLPAVASLVLSALALGRSGIGASLLLLLGIVAAMFIGPRLTENRWLMRGVYLALFVITAGFLIRHLDQLLFILGRFREFGLGSDARSAIRADYLSRVHGVEALVGFDGKATFAGYLNVHNSYLFWHRQLGAFAVPLYVVTVLAACLAPRRGIVVLTVLLALLFRSFFDESILPFRLHDYAFFAIIATVFFDPGGGLQIAPADPLIANRHPTAESQ